MDIRLRRVALCALAVLGLGVGPCNLTKQRSDIDSDGWIDAMDETTVETCIGPPQGSWPICARADVISDGLVNQRDLDAVRSYLGEALFTPAPPSFVPTDVELGATGVLYLHAPDAHEIFRWSLAAQHWLRPIYVGAGTRHLAYSAAHRRLYVAYANGAIRQIDADLPLDSAPFATLRAQPDGLEAAGPYVFASDASGIKGTHYTFAEDGAPISAEEWRWYSSAFAWSDELGRMYYFQDPVSPNDLLWDAIDPGTGAIVQDGESPYHSDLEIAGPIRVSPDGARVLLASGDVYAAPDLWLETSLPFAPVDAAWVEDGDLLTLSATQEGDTLLRHWSGELALYNLQAYPGSPMRVFAWEAGVFAVLTLVDGSVQIHPYVPTNDADGDAVANEQDAFPLDPAASLDSDGDGFPDAWNNGQGPEDSPSGLQLDAFPYDSACQLLEHAPPGEPCDVAATIPPYVPARIEMDTAGIVYLLSSDNDRVYRWSTSWGTHLNPILVGDAPRHIAYSEENGRLYVGYADGAITQIDVTEPFPKEQAFAAVPGELRGLQTAGRFLYADTRASWGGREWHRTWAPDGTPISARSHSAYHSAGFTWSAVQGRMYLTTLGLSPLTLRWVGIDPQTGQVAVPGGSLAHDLLIQQPIRLSLDESRLLLGSGALFDPGSLAVEGGLLEPITDAVWTAERLQSVRPDGASTLVEEWTHTPTLQNVARLPGTPLRILSHQGVTIVVTRVDGRPVFHFYEPGTDADGDGVAWSEDAFPFDPAASQDSDRDGYPDAWNAGSGPEHSTEGLALDAFPLDMACQLPEHGGGGVCDAQGILPSSAAEPFCELDELPAQPSGTLSLGTAGYWPRTDFVPLCSGWVLRADDRNEQVVVQNLATGRSGARYALPAMPGDLDLDEASKRLYVALPMVPGFAAIDLITGEIQRIHAPGVVYGVAVGPDGGVFVGATPAVNAIGGYGAKLYWLAPGAASLSGGWTVSGQLMRWNAGREELVVGGYGSGTPSLVRYAFDPATGPVALQTRSPAGNAGHELAVSPDGQHIAYSAGSNRLGTGEIADFVAGDLSSHLGIWTLGTNTSGVAFEAGGERLIAATNTSIQIFDVATHARLRSFAAPACVYSGWVPKVAFSRGGRLALARQICSQQGSMTERYHWFATD